ncbi:MAG: molybdopterin converting factor subunit 1 [Gammaproteobacteria bacterium]|nr:molybdopterin converting factor subunit 1 [Gammaproteobacteria bacterium]
MKVNVLFFASLREAQGRASLALEAPDLRSVADVWAAANDGAPIPANVLMAVNHEYVESDHRVRDGDEVAFFPPVTGG